MIAQFESECPLCPYEIERGQSLVRDEDSERWAHAECVARKDRREAAQAVCTDCFIVKPCECDS